MHVDLPMWHGKYASMQINLGYLIDKQDFFYLAPDVVQAKPTFDG